MNVGLNTKMITKINFQESFQNVESSRFQKRPKNVLVNLFHNQILILALNSRFWFQRASIQFFVYHF